MVKQMIWAFLAIFVSWLVLDFLLHRLLLRSTYDATANLWRPMDQLNLPLVYFVMLVLILSFELIYGFLIDNKSLGSGIKFGALFGLAISISSGFGTYIHMPIYMGVHSVK
jgi:hypothetical protein